jgi:GrpB-like predicted nucleotidyltransferase (UPF0157 family)
MSFRDRLRADPGLAREYAALKRMLAERFPDDREKYTDAKSEFIRRHVQSAPPPRQSAAS